MDIHTYETIVEAENEKEAEKEALKCQKKNGMNEESQNSDKKLMM